jgi:UDP-N-acetylmuramoylalanine--D-glutamate ligase
VSSPPSRPKARALTCQAWSEIARDSVMKLPRLRGGRQARGAKITPVNPPPPKPRPALPPGPYLVVGLARSGAAVARTLAARGEQVLGCDSGHPEQAAGLSEAGVEVNLDVDGTELLDGVATVVKSPGVPQDAVAIRVARERGIPVTGELEVSWRLIPNPFVAVTGTNGKTTTVELIGHLFREAELPVAVAGNVGTPVASLVGEVGEEETIACECSSFQLEDTDAFAPECAVFLNLESDHLDRHSSLEGYLEAKLGIFANQGPEDLAVVNGDEPRLAGRELGGEAQRIQFCPQHRPLEPNEPRPEGAPVETTAEPCDLRIEDGRVQWRQQPLIEADQLRLLGAHNVANAMAAAAATLVWGLEPETVAHGLREFTGVAHRLEPIAEIGGVLYVNDSKATNVASALAGVESFDRGLHLILGGSLKGEGFSRLVEPVVKRCRACYLMGEAAERIAADLAPAAERGVELRRFDDLPQAFEAASGAARPGETVLLSPACASFDAYPDFEARGEHFRSLVEGLR